MKSLLCLALGVLPVCAGQPGAPLAPIALYTQFPQEPPPELRHSVQKEVEAIMAPMGLNFRWINLADSDGRQVAVELAVVYFRGRCDVDGLLTHDTNPGPLGWTHISDGA